MPVKVVSSSPRTRANSEHPDGADIDIRDGHLIVTSDSRDEPVRRIAIYAPGSWVSAEIMK